MLLSDFVHTTLVMTSPILLAALGGMFTDLAGTLNIGLEGMLLASAFVSLSLANATSSLFWGIVGSIIVSVMLSILMTYLVFNLKANIFVVGLATNLFADGLTVFLQRSLYNTKGTLLFTQVPTLSLIRIPFVDSIPFIGRILSGYTALDYLTIILVLLCYYLIFHTPYGYHLRAVGKDPMTAKSAGISVYRQRVLSFVLSGVFTGLGGAALALPLKVFVGGMTNGRGWIALVAMVLGKGNPFGIFAAALLFGASAAFSYKLQALTDISPRLLMTVPFIVVLITMIISSIRKAGRKR